MNVHFTLKTHGILDFVYLMGFKGQMRCSQNMSFVDQHARAYHFVSGDLKHAAFPQIGNFGDY
jgi:hypothetical protein